LPGFVNLASIISATRIWRRQAGREGRRALSSALGEKDYLEGRFTAGDLIMTTVLRELVNSGTLSRFSNLDRFRERCEARPAFDRAMEGQMRAFRENAPS
jgi:glutathione S-transferase